MINYGMEKIDVQKVGKCSSEREEMELFDKSNIHGKNFSIKSS